MCTTILQNKYLQTKEKGVSHLLIQVTRSLLTPGL